MNEKMKQLKEPILIRPEREEDRRETEAMVRRAFYNKHVPGCNEHLMVRKMRSHPDYLPKLSRVAVIGGRIAGGIFYFRCHIEKDGKRIPVLSFGPLCADHRYKNHGVGKALLEATLPLAREASWPGIVIMGEPGYYPKRGFVRAGSLGLTDAEGNTYDPFMAYELIPGALHIPGGRFIESSLTEDLPEEELQAMEQEFEPIMRAYRPCQWTYEDARDETDGYHLQYAVEAPREFDKLFYEYIGELSGYDETLWEHSIPDMLGEIRDSVCKTPYLIRVGGEPAGLLVTSVPGPEDGEDGCAAYLEEIYLKKEYRHRGIAGDVFIRFLRQQKGNTGFCVIKNNIPAVRRWEGLLEKHGYAYEKEQADEENSSFYRVKLRKE